MPRGGGPLPADLPPHVTIIPPVDGEVGRFFCLVCGGHEHARQRVLFFSRHAQCGQERVGSDSAFGAQPAP